MKCLITEKFNEEGISALQNHFDVSLAYGKTIDEIKSMIQDYDVLIVRAETPVDADMIDKAVNLKAIGMAGIGLNHIDVNYAKSKDIAVFNVPSGSTDSVAELTLGLMLSTMRKIIPANNFVKSGNWNKTAYIGNLIKGKTVGILAMGKIGYKVASLCKAFDAKEIIAYDPYLNPEIAKTIGAEILSLDEVLKRADIISVHTPLTPETHHMISKNQFDMMKDGSYLFNLGRGGIVDEDALYDALVSGKLAGAGFDVMEVEPPTSDNKLFKLDNFNITCHIGAGSHEAQSFIAENLSSQIISYCKERAFIK